MNQNITTFNEWAKLDKDKLMQNGHSLAVNEMFNLIKNKSNIFDSKFSFIDLGCGNGWTVREILRYDNCNKAIGIDGSLEMIKKSKEHKRGTFINCDIEKYQFTSKYDIVFSMETFYYFNNINKVIENIYNFGLKKNGICIIGIDHYRENYSTLNWNKKYNLSTTTLSIKQWEKKFTDEGFKKISTNIFGAKKSWNGTLILLNQL